MCQAASRYLGKRLAGRFQNRGVAREILPSKDAHVDIRWMQFDRVARAAGHFRRNDRGAGADERIVNRLVRRGIVFDWPLHALDGLLSRVTAVHFLGFWDIPDGSLITAPEREAARWFSKATP
jgi:hypothetical protein